MRLSLKEHYTRITVRLGIRPTILLIEELKVFPEPEPSTTYGAGEVGRETMVVPKKKNFLRFWEPTRDTRCIEGNRAPFVFNLPSHIPVVTCGDINLVPSVGCSQEHRY